MSFSYVFNIVLVAFAFGFVIFWHELGHFLAARWAGVRVEQFAVGMGQAVFSWRKGIGFRPGNTQTEWDRRVDEEIGKRGAGRLPAEYSLRERYDIGKEIGLGETDYRFNWIPLGGYVKPTGQDDLRPASLVGADDPHAFGAKPVGKRMVIICAGVIMNVILAFALYVVLFLHGFNAPPTVIGFVIPGSPAQAAGLKSGDRIVAIDGHLQQDFTKLKMNTALLRSDEPAVFTIDRPGEGELKKPVTPVKSTIEFGMSSIGVSGAGSLEAAIGLDAEPDLISPELDAMPAKSRVVKIGDQDVSKEKDDHLLNVAAAAAAGRPVPVTIRLADGSEKPYLVQSSMMRTFNAAVKQDTRSIAGLQPRIRVTAVQRGAPADKAGLKPGDVIAQVASVASNESLSPPTIDQFVQWTAEAGKAGKAIRITVIRDGKTLDPIQVDPTLKVGHDFRIGVVPDLDLGEPVVANVIDGSPMQTRVKRGERIVSIGSTPTADWPAVLAALRWAKGPIDMHLSSEAGERTVSVDLGENEKQSLAAVAFQPMLPLAPLITPRITKNPLEAAAWGYEETKASLFQVYVTLSRLFEGQVPLSNLSGPVGIFTAGTSAASRGIDWLIWFTALISANLAVVNFLPIPIVDGGLFTFLVAEKITGKPPSPKVQTAAQIAGILLLGSLFLFVTYHDILRQWG
ncbi:MAG: peptidase family protein [Phycisphaerales bacterium]|nr:peptidase family protein [Phycisphaerales bacterium]